MIPETQNPAAGFGCRIFFTTDAMTATVEEIPYPVLHKIVGRITAEVEGINRVLMDLTPKPYWVWRSGVYSGGV